MSKVITFSTKFPSYHPKAGQPTNFVEKIWESLDKNYYSTSEVTFNMVHSLTGGDESFIQEFFNTLSVQHLSPKHHTIRSGNRWKVGDRFSPRIWGNDVNPKSGRSGPYHSKQIIIAPDIEIKKVWDITIYRNHENPTDFVCLIHTPNGDLYPSIAKLSENDGLEISDFKDWFKDEVFTGQIICWNENINY